MSMKISKKTPAPGLQLQCLPHQPLISVDLGRKIHCAWIPVRALPFFYLQLLQSRSINCPDNCCQQSPFWTLEGVWLLLHLLAIPQRKDSFLCMSWHSSPPPSTLHGSLSVPLTGSTPYPLSLPVLLWFNPVLWSLALWRLAAKSTLAALSTCNPALNS